MSVTHSILMRMFGRPMGSLGRLGGIIMARSNQKCAAWVASLLDLRSNDRVLEVGFGPGVGIEILLGSVAEGFIAGVDPSVEMLRQAKIRNAHAIESGRADLRSGTVDSLPFADNVFDKALAINSMQVWPDSLTGLREIRRVMKAGGKIALGFNPYSGQSKQGLVDMLADAGFIETDLMEAAEGFCVLGIKYRRSL